jgi:hypothetical protein
MRNKSNLLLAAVVCLLIAGVAAASSPPWTGDGVYTFDDTDPFIIEGGIYDTATLNINGGSIDSLVCFNFSTVNMYSGDSGGISAGDYSTVNLHGGDIEGIDIASTATMNLFVDSHELNLDSYLGYDRITGVWQNDNGIFDILVHEGQYHLINFVPEPCTLILLSLGSLLMRHKK